MSHLQSHLKEAVSNLQDCFWITWGAVFIHVDFLLFKNLLNEWKAVENIRKEEHFYEP